jgi:8-oxo-dGTP pyrophosphatase MutT (NUDIX family)
MALYSSLLHFQLVIAQIFYSAKIKLPKTLYSLMNIETITNALSKYKPVTAPETPAAAAVLVLLIVDETDPISIVVTKRPDIIQTYAGDYCFPGGMRENNEDLKATAIRETMEELHIASTDYQMLGQLDDFYDRFDNLVRPFVAVMTKLRFSAQCQTSQSEIQELYFFPLGDLDKFADNNILELLTGRHPSYSYQHDAVYIWGLTASIMVHFHNVITGANQPIAKRRQ